MKYPTLSLIALLLGAAACDDAPADCLAGDPTDCAPLYDPTFANVYERTLIGSCAVGGSACHGSDGATSDLRLVDRAQAHAALLAYLTPGDAVCSPLSTRLDGVGAGQMPPGAQLDAAAKCAVRQWIADGARP